MPAPWSGGRGGVARPPYSRGLGRSAPTPPGQYGKAVTRYRRFADDDLYSRRVHPVCLTVPIYLSYHLAMVKLRLPLFSFRSQGRLGSLSFLRRRHQNIAESSPDIIDAQSAPQLSWRTMFQLAVEMWHALSAAEKAIWERNARPLHMTGYAWFISQALRPNPGIYLPLAGGTMSGDIDMDSNRVSGLPLPTANPHAANKEYVDAALAAAVYTQGARVYNSANQSINHMTATTLLFDSERYDTDDIHSTIANTSRLTCKTAGKYVVTGNVAWDTNAAGFRLVYIRHNVSASIAQIQNTPLAAHYTEVVVSTIFDFAVNEYVELRVYQDSGGALNIMQVANYSAEFMMQRIG